MGSLSIWTYYRNNKRKVVPLTGIIALAILAISSTGALTESLFEDARREFLYLYDRYARVDSVRALGLSGPMMAQLADHPAVAEVLPVESPGTRTQGIFGGSHVHIYFVPAAAQRPVASQLGWELSEGRWPEPGTNEVAITQNVLRNRGLEVGDRIGHDVDEKDFLRGEWLVTGALRYRRAVGGIGDLDYFLKFRLDELEFPAELIEGPGHVFLLPEEGSETELEAYLDSLSEDEVRVHHRSKGERALAENIANANIVIWVLNGVTIVVISLSMGLLNVIFFMQRANEFGLLAALGYTKGFLMRRTFLEAAVTVTAGWGLGIVVTQGIYSVVNALLFIPNGLAPLTILTPRVILFTTPVPITVTVFSVIVVMWQLWRMDPVAIIERRD